MKKMKSRKMAILRKMEHPKAKIQKMRVRKKRQLKSQQGEQLLLQKANIRKTQKAILRNQIFPKKKDPNQKKLHQVLVEDEDVEEVARQAWPRLLENSPRKYLQTTEALTATLSLNPVKKKNLHQNHLTLTMNQMMISNPNAKPQQLQDQVVDVEYEEVQDLKENDIVVEAEDSEEKRDA